MIRAADLHPASLATLGQVGPAGPAAVAVPGMAWPLPAVAAALAGLLAPLAASRAGTAADAAPERLVQRVTLDSRHVASGDLFVALPGARVDGHDFVAASLAAGAVAAVVERPLAGVDPARLLVVRSSEQALQRLAAVWREQHPVPAIAVTGSNGKTTVKGMIAAILAAEARAAGCDPATTVLATRGNLNNHLGLPLTLLQLRPTHRRAVFELGMNHAGELTLLAGLARPQVALVTNVQRAHVGHFAGLAAVAAAKGEIFSGLVPGGVAVINADDGSAGQLRAQAGAQAVQTFACDGVADVGPLLAAQPSDTGQVLTFRVDGAEQRCTLALPGRHNASNALAAIAATRALGVPVATACTGLAGFGGAPGRLQRRAGRLGAQIIDDTYNANPDSVLAALQVLAACPGRRVLVLGDLGELGEGAAALHAELGHASRAAGIDLVLGLGEQVGHATAAFGAPARTTGDPAELLEWLEALLGPDLTILVKGSRFMQMERIVDPLTS